MTTNLPDETNPFLALGVATRELSYSQVIAKHVLTHQASLQALVALLRPSWGEVELASQPLTEHSLGAAGRVDVYAQLRRPGESMASKVLVIETKFNAHQAKDQLVRYSQALGWAENQPQPPYPEPLVVGLKLVPASLSLTEAESIANNQGIALMNSTQLATCLGPHNPHGLKDMLVFLGEAETALRQDPAAVGRGEGRLHCLIKKLMPWAVDEFKFMGFLAAVKAQGRDDWPRHDGGMHVTRGGGLTQYFEKAWQSKEKKSQVHFELKGYGNMALHVEVNPHSNASIPEQLAAKNHLLTRLQQGFAPEGIPGWKKLAPRKGWDGHASSTLGVLAIDWEDLSGSAQRFIQIYEAFERHIDTQCPIATWD